jgi:hypothetical protein
MKKWDDKLILSDCDDVLLSWEWAFTVWMQEKGYTIADGHKKTYALHHWFTDLELPDARKLIVQFNESAAIGFLPAFRDSMFYVKRLYEEHGYRFHVITSLSLDGNAGRLREMNLHKMFGDAIVSVECLDTGADKGEALAPYKGSGLFWVEDKYSNYKLGLDMGLNSILMVHGHNMNEDPLNGKIVHSWKDIYEYITAK